VTVEEQLRAAGRAVTDQVRDLPRLTLPPTAVPARHRRNRGPHRRPRWSAWLIPLAAGAAVAVIAATLVAVRDIPSTTHRPAAKPAASSSAAATTRPVTYSEALPRYFVSLSGPAITSLTNWSKPTSLLVGETRTGKVVARIAGRSSLSFIGVSGAADDRTFVVEGIPVSGSQPGFWLSVPRIFYLLRLDPNTGLPGALVRLPIAPTPAFTKVDGLALSPDGTRFAVLYQVGRSNGGYPYTGPFVLRTYSVATGKLLRAWTGRDPRHGSYASADDRPVDSNSTLSWTTDGQQVGFTFSSSNGGGRYLRVVDMRSPGKDLFADSRIVVGGKGPDHCNVFTLTGDGRSAVCGAYLPESAPAAASLDAWEDPWQGCPKPTDPVRPGFLRYSAATGMPDWVLYPVKAACTSGEAELLWVSQSGKTILGAMYYATGKNGTPRHPLYLISGDSVRQLNWPSATSLSGAAF
jgi:hypothetical protein